MINSSQTNVKEGAIWRGWSAERKDREIQEKMNFVFGDENQILSSTKGKDVIRVQRKMGG